MYFRLSILRRFLSRVKLLKTTKANMCQPILSNTMRLAFLYFSFCVSISLYFVTHNTLSRVIIVATAAARCLFKTLCLRMDDFKQSHEIRFVSCRRIFLFHPKTELCEQENYISGDSFVFGNDKKKSSKTTATKVILFC